MTSPRVYTYHCLYCSHLVVASTHTLSSLPRRRDPGLDNAYIFPLPPPPKTASTEEATEDSESSDSEAETEITASSASSIKRDKDSYTLLLTLTRDRLPKVITREDGFEKRYIWKCGRCKVVVGYQLDEQHYELGPKSDTHNASRTVIVGGGDAGADKDRALKEKKRVERERRRKGLWFYVLPGALVVSEELGRSVEAREVELVKGT